MLTCVLIPAFNEERYIRSVIRKIKAQKIDVIVVDDGSRDNTASAVIEESAVLIKHPCNKGKGAALRSGFRLVLDKGYDIVITMDADGQHDPDEIPRFLEKSRDGGAGIIIGNRMHSPRGMPAARIFCNTYGSKITSKAARQYIPDALIGYKLIKSDVLKAIELESDRYEIDPEMLIKASLAGFKIDHINIECIYGSHVSRIRPLVDGYCFLRMVRRSSRKEK